MKGRKGENQVSTIEQYDILRHNKSNKDPIYTAIKRNTVHIVDIVFGISMQQSLNRRARTSIVQSERTIK